MVDEKIRFTISGLCAFWAKNWGSGTNRDLGRAEVVLIDAGKSEYRNPNGSKLCQHVPWLLYPESEGANIYLQKHELGNSRTSRLQSLVDRSRKKVIHGLMPLRGRKLDIFFCNSRFERIDHVGASKNATFDAVLNFEAVGQSSNYRYRSLLIDPNRVGGLVASRFSVMDGEISSGLIHEQEYLFYPESSFSDRAPRTRIVQEIFWDIEVPDEATYIAIESLGRFSVVGGLSREEILYFSIGNPGMVPSFPRPNFSISNLCGYEWPLPEVGRDFAAYYDLLNRTISPDRRNVMHIPRDQSGDAKSGSGFCPPVRFEGAES